MGCGVARPENCVEASLEIPVPHSIVMIVCTMSQHGYGNNPDRSKPFGDGGCQYAANLPPLSMGALLDQQLGWINSSPGGSINSLMGRRRFKD